MDIYPTILDLLDIDNPENHFIDGHSLRAQLNGEGNHSNKKTFFMHFPHEHRSSYFTSFRKEEWKLIYHYNPKNPKEPSCELFNLEKDQSESHNKAFSKPNRLASMIESMVHQLEKEGALYPEDINGNALRPFIPKKYLKKIIS